MRKLKYVLITLSILFVFNFIKGIFGFETHGGDVPRVEINEELVFQDEKNADKLFDINTVGYEDIVGSGISSKEAYKILEYRDFVGYIDNVDYLIRARGINKGNIDRIKKNFYVEETEEKEYVKHNINALDEDGLYMLGFSKQDVKTILDLRNSGEIKSDLDLKGKVNMNIVSKHIQF